MFESFRNIFKIPDLRKKIFFTIALLLAYRVGGHVPLPGVDAKALSVFFEQQKGTLFGLFDLFAGGNLKKATIFALGIMPYISSSIIFQLLGAVVPYLERLSKEGEAGRKKITQYTRYGTLILSAVQGMGISVWLESLPSPSGMPIVPHPGWAFKLLTVITLTAGTTFIMWLGEKITERGIGNGISLIIFIGIIAAFPNATFMTVNNLFKGELNITSFILVLIIMVSVIMAVVIMQQAQRRVRVQYAKRVVGRRVYGGQETHIPLRVNTAGVIPVIFAASVIMFPSTIISFMGGKGSQEGFLATLANLFSPQSVVYYILYGLLIIFFTYFYTAIVLNPNDLADNMRKYGGFVPGIRPGKNTAQHIDRILSRITLVGAIYLALVAVLPSILVRAFQVPFWFGGTGLLIVVGVALDTMRQVESHLLMRHYEGFVKKGRLRGRV